MAELCFGCDAVAFVVEEVPSVRVVPSDGFAKREGLPVMSVRCLG
jgi:hypothetical protein